MKERRLYTVELLNWFFFVFDGMEWTEVDIKCLPKIA
jgi:hypothetical protein